MSGVHLLASRYPSVVEAVFDDMQQAETAVRALENFDLGNLPEGFDRFTLVERRLVADTSPSAAGGWRQRLRALFGQATEPSNQEAPRRNVVVLVRGEAARLRAAMSVLREHGARAVELHVHRDGQPASSS